MATQTTGERPPIRLVFNERKATQAAAYLLQLGGGSMDRVRLIKLLYYADRKMLLECGRTITGDAMVSMKHGPVLSRVYDFIKENPLASSIEWSAFIGNRGSHEIFLKEPAPMDELSQYDVSLLDSIHSEYKHLSTWRLRDSSHDLPEYTKTDGPAIPIRLEAILNQRPNISSDDIERIREDAEELLFFSSLSR
jgi:uncharacterized phage-associated protein